MRVSSRLAIALIALLYAPYAVRAQSATPAAAGTESSEALQQARQAFEEGTALAAQERWFDAAAAFRRSRSFMERSSTVFNLASVLFRLGAFVEAERAIQDYFAIAAADDKQRAEAERLKGLITEGLVRIELHVEPADSTVRIDAAEQPGQGATRKLQLDPGSHVLAVRHEGYHEHSERIETQAGQALRLEVKLDPLPATPVAAPVAALTPAPAPAREQDDDDGFFEQPVVWIVGGVLIAAAAVTTAVLIANQDDEPERPFGGSSGMVLVAGHAP